MGQLSSRLYFVARGLRVPAISIGLVVVGCAIVDYRQVIWPIGTGLGVLGLITLTLYQLSALESAGKANDVQAGKNTQTQGAAHLVQDLLSPYPPYAAAAAEKLGEIRDAAAVPSLINVLDRSVWRSESGWDIVCVAIVQALARIGDGRALPVLNRVRAARGVDFSDEVDSAITCITSLGPAGIGSMSVKPYEVICAPFVVAGGEQCAPQTAPPGRTLLPLADYGGDDTSNLTSPNSL
jgi:hypothetical protein